MALGDKAVGAPQVVEIVTACCCHQCNLSGGRVGQGDKLTASPRTTADSFCLPRFTLPPQILSAPSAENLIPLPFSFLGRLQLSQPPLEERKGQPGHEN